MVFDIFFDYFFFFVGGGGGGGGGYLNLNFLYLKCKVNRKVQKLNNLPTSGSKHQHRRHEETTNNKYNSISEVLFNNKMMIYTT